MVTEQDLTALIPLDKEANSGQDCTCACTCGSVKLWLRWEVSPPPLLVLLARSAVPLVKESSARKAGLITPRMLPDMLLRLQGSQAVMGTCLW